MASIKGIIVEIGGDTSGLQKALSKVNSSTSSLSRELKGVNSLLKLDPKNTELVAQKQQILKENIEQTSKKIEELKKTQEMADKTIAEGGEISQENYRNLQREIINAENKLKELKVEASNWTKAGRSIQEFGSKVTNISSKIDKLGTTLTTRLTLPIATMATILVKETADFESAFAGVEKTVDGTATQMEKLKQGIKDMAEELPSSTTEIAAVAEAAGQLGIQTDNILGFSKAMIDLGNSTNLTSEEAASQLAKFANVMQMSQKDFDKLGSSIVDLGNNFATTETDIVNMAMRLAGAGKQVGFSEGQVLGLATALSSVGIEAEMGGSAISKAMVKMQNAVEMGGDKLNTVLKKTGLTLRELELMSANDSKGFKDLAQSIGMTSTEVKQLITAGTNLEDFAAVSGMTAEQFKKAWKEDASGALSSFIKGLGDAEDKGQSAITMLSEMGLTEVRLRDSLLRAANAGDLFNNAIETGTKAWEENTALTNEANKRYATLESRLKTTKNKILNVATSTGDKLTPTFNKLLDKVDDLVDKFDDLSEEEINSIIKTTALVAAIGPAVKILGTLGKGLGTVTKGVGTFSQAIAVVRNNTISAVPSVNNLANVIKSLTSPVGFAITSIGALAGAYMLLKHEADKLPEKLQTITEETKRAKQSHEEYRNELDKTASSNLAQIKNTGDLRDELSKLVDENGKVKEGYKDRVTFILNELNEALGTEYSLTGDIINQYKKLQDEIDVLILKKKAQTILENEEEKYSEALRNKDDAYQKLIDSQNEYNDALKGKTYEEFFEDLKQNYIDAGYTAEKSAEYAKDWMSKWIDGYKEAYETNKGIYDDYIKDVSKYENDFTIMQSNNTEEIEKMVNARIYSYGKEASTREEQIKSGIQQELYNIQELKKIREEDLRNQDEISAQAHASSIESGEKRLQSLIENLAAQTSIINENSPEVIEAWKALANGSYGSYSETVSQMPPEMQQKIQEMTGVIAGGTPQMQEQAEELGRKTVEEFDKSADSKEKALNTIEGYLQGLSDEEKREFLKQAGIDNVDTVLDELDRGDLSEENGKNILEGLWNGLKNNTWQGKILGVASGLAQAVNKAFTGKDGWDEHSPSKKMKKFAEYYIQPISDVMNDRKKSIVSTAQGLASKINDVFNGQINMPQINDFDKLQGSLKNQIIDSTKTIFTTPNLTIYTQEFDARKIANEVNKIFGSQY